MDIKIHFDNEYNVKDTTDIGTIKILMLKGEKGDSGSGGGSVTDVTVNNVSVVSSGVANIPKSSGSAYGVAKISSVGDPATMKAKFEVANYEGDSAIFVPRLDSNDKIRPAQLPDVVRYVSQTLTDAQKTQARNNIGAASIADLGTVFTIKGDVATVNDLPSSGNAVGDVYYVQSVSAAFVWLETTAHPNGYWEEFGEPIDLSVYIEKPTNPATGSFLLYNGTTWVAQTLATWQGGSY